MSLIVDRLEELPIGVEHRRDLLRSGLCLRHPHVGVELVAVLQVLSAGLDPIPLLLPIVDHAREPAALLKPLRGYVVGQDIEMTTLLQRVEEELLLLWSGILQYAERSVGVGVCHHPVRQASCQRRLDLRELFGVDT